MMVMTPVKRIRLMSDLICAECGSLLTVRDDRVEPCSICMDDEYNQGHQDADDNYDEGWSKGYKLGYDEGYAAGESCE